MLKKIDVVLLANGPGEVTTWMPPVLQQLQQQTENIVGIRISVVLSPCPHGTGREAAIARSYGQVDRVLPPEQFWSFLLWGKTPKGWQWSSRGVVLFLGGDQFFAVAIARRLGYRSVVYAEWEARWARWIDRFGVAKPQIIQGVKRRQRHKLTLVGDLIVDIQTEGGWQPDHHRPTVGLLPGSKGAKLAQGVPLSLAIAESVARLHPQTRFMMPVAPTVTLAQLARYADPKHNVLIQKTGWSTAKLVRDPIQPYLQTPQGLKIRLIVNYPAYRQLQHCNICITTVGANTAQLAALGVPMLVLLPTQQLDAMRAWDGIPGILANLPGIGSIMAKLINLIVLRQKRLFAWPNIWAKGEVVPELVGKLEPGAVGKMVVDYLHQPDKLAQMSRRLDQITGEFGAARKLVAILVEEIKHIIQ